MKQFNRILIVCSLLVAGVAAKAQTLDEIVANHVKAIGGADNWKKVTSVHFEGTMSVQGTDVNVGMTVVAGKGFRQDISVMGMNGFQIVTPTAGWNFMPFQGQADVEAMTDEDVKESQDELDPSGELVDYQAKGRTVTLEGKDDVDGTECFKLTVLSKTGKSKTLFIDPKSWFIIKAIEKVKANGQEMEQAINYSNYKLQPEGIYMPLSMTLPFGEMIISKIEINKPIDEAVFKPAK